MKTKAWAVDAVHLPSRTARTANGILFGPDDWPAMQVQLRPKTLIWSARLHKYVRPRFSLHLMARPYQDVASFGLLLDKSCQARLRHIFDFCGPQQVWRLQVDPSAGCSTDQLEHGTSVSLVARGSDRSLPPLTLGPIGRLFIA